MKEHGEVDEVKIILEKQENLMSFHEIENYQKRAFHL
jgi:hypothetical protein